MAKMKVNIGTPASPNWVILDANDGDSVDGLHFRIHEGKLQYSSDNSTWHNTGVNATDATATEEDIVEGKTAYAGDGKITGVIDKSTLIEVVNEIKLGNDKAKTNIANAVNTLNSGVEVDPEGTWNSIVEDIESIGEKYKRGFELGNVDLINFNYASHNAIQESRSQMLDDEETIIFNDTSTSPFTLCRFNIVNGIIDIITTLPESGGVVAENFDPLTGRTVVHFRNSGNMYLIYLDGTMENIVNSTTIRAASIFKDYVYYEDGKTLYKYHIETGATTVVANLTNTSSGYENPDNFKSIICSDTLDMISVVYIYNSSGTKYYGYQTFNYSDDVRVTIKNTAFNRSWYWGGARNNRKLLIMAKPTSGSTLYMDYMGEGSAPSLSTRTRQDTQFLHGNFGSYGIGMNYDGTYVWGRDNTSNDYYKILKTEGVGGESVVDNGQMVSPINFYSPRHDVIVSSYLTYHRLNYQPYHDAFQTSTPVGASNSYKNMWHDIVDYANYWGRTALSGRFWAYHANSGTEVFIRNNDSIKFESIAGNLSYNWTVPNGQSITNIDGFRNGVSVRCSNANMYWIPDEDYKNPIEITSMTGLRPDDNYGWYIYGQSHSNNILTITRYDVRDGSSVSYDIPNIPIYQGRAKLVVSGDMKIFYFQVHQDSTQSGTVNAYTLYAYNTETEELREIAKLPYATYTNFEETIASYGDRAVTFSIYRTSYTGNYTNYTPYIDEMRVNRIYSYDWDEDEIVLYSRSYYGGKLIGNPDNIPLYESMTSSGTVEGWITGSDQLHWLAGSRDAIRSFTGVSSGFIRSDGETWYHLSNYYYQSTNYISAMAVSRFAKGIVKIQ